MRTRPAGIAILAIAAASVLAAQQPTLPPAARNAGDVIQQGNLKRDADYLASDALKGRKSPSPGLDSAAAYVERRLRALKLTPAGDAGTYRQQYTVRTVTLDTAATWLELNGRRLPYGDNLLVQNFDDSLTISGPMVYVAHGMVVPKKGIDPFAGVDVRGKIVIAHGPIAFPIGENFTTLGAMGVDWFLSWQTAEKRGAKAIIFLPGANTLNRWNGLRAADVTLNKTDMYPSVPAAYQPPKFPMVVVRPNQLGELFAGTGINIDSLATMSPVARRGFPAPFALDPAKVATIHFATRGTREQRLPNVVARIEGSDPQLRREAVVLMSHLDGAVGDFPPTVFDTIYNAADDNVSGSVGLLAVAEAMMRAPRPKRSVVFIWDTGEEVGLWGSRYYSEHPVVPLRDVVAHYNVDMIGRTKLPGDTLSQDVELAGVNEIYVVGPRVMSTELDSLIERTNRSLDQLSLNHKFDVSSSDWFYPRSDGGPLLERGVPVINFQVGEHVDYHGVGDEPAKLDLDKMRKVSRLVFATAWLLADSPTRPKLDKGIPSTVPRMGLQP